jgi:hypothetical protein
MNLPFSSTCYLSLPRAHLSPFRPA